jgi:hypothetical protein
MHDFQLLRGSNTDILLMACRFFGTSAAAPASNDSNNNAREAGYACPHRSFSLKKPRQSAGGCV